MDLDEMKNTWAQMSAEIENQKRLTDKIILKMAHQKSSRSIGKLKRFEMFGGPIMGTLLIIMISVAMFNGLFESLGLKIFAVLSILIFLVSMYASWKFISKLGKVNLLENSIEDSQKYFQAVKSSVKNQKKMGLFIMIPTIVFFAPVVMKIFTGHDIFLNFSDSTDELLLILFSSFAVGIPVMFLVLRYYKKNMKAAGQAYEEIDGE